MDLRPVCDFETSHAFVKPWFADLGDLLNVDLFNYATSKKKITSVNLITGLIHTTDKKVFKRWVQGQRKNPVGTEREGSRAQAREFLPEPKFAGTLTVDF